MRAGAAAPYELVLFDLDGTLIDTVPDIADALAAALRDTGRAPFDEAQVRHGVGHGTAALLARAAGQAAGEPPPDLVARYDHHFRQFAGRRSRPYPRLHETLAALRAQGARLVLLTNKERRYTEALLAAHTLDQSFDALVCGDTQPTRKPDPAGLLACLQRFGVARGRALLVGDSRIDVATARAAGIAVWLVPYGYNQGEPPASAAPDRVIADLGALLGG
jgi:phosphoglycolate phosphatase